MDYDRWSDVLDESRHLNVEEEQNNEEGYRPDEKSHQAYLIKYIRILILLACVTVIYLVGIHLIFSKDNEEYMIRVPRLTYELNAEFEQSNIAT